MSDSTVPDLTGEQQREHEAAAGGIEARAVLLDIDTDDQILDAADHGDVDDDAAIEDAGAEEVASDV